MIVYKTSLPNSLYGHLTPPEDTYLVKGNVFCVADGITRDPVSPKNFRGLSTEKVLAKYPNPSGARLAADTFCQVFVSYLSQKQASLKAVKDAFISGNKKIVQLNKKNIKKVDYLVNDFFGCVASGGVIKGDKLFWGRISDCEIIIYNKKGKIKFRTPDRIKVFLDYERKNLCRPDFNFSQPEYRRLIRSEYRNNPEKIVNYKCISYGALTGEKAAEKFMDFGEVKLDKGDLVVFYTDGFKNIIGRKDFFRTIYQSSESLIDQKFITYALSLAKESNSRFGHERTLVAIIY